MPGDRRSGNQKETDRLMNLPALLRIAAVCVNLRQGAMTPILTAI